MNQICKVCSEPAAGFHFGAFTCEGCKSFFGRSYNNLGSISECKNNGECVINKKNRTSCKACRLRKCILVGMSKSGSRYGRRSNWFKIHCLLQEQQNQHQSAVSSLPPLEKLTSSPPHTRSLHLSMMNHQPYNHHTLMQQMAKTKDELILLGMEDYSKNAASPTMSSPDSHNSDSSLDLNEVRRIPLFHGLIPAPFMPPPGLLFPPGYAHLYPNLLQPTNNNNRQMRNHNTVGVEAFHKRVYLDAVLQSQRARSPESTKVEPPSVQEDPMDLSMKTSSDNDSSTTHSGRSSSVETERGAGSEADEEESDCDSHKEVKRIKVVRPTPLDLTTMKMC